MAQHLSIRIPWKDNGYDGLVCDNPCSNSSCLKLKNISENRDDKYEALLAGYPMLGHEKELPCIAEGGVFMSADTHKRVHLHPYKRDNSGTHGHFLETELVYPPFSLPARPFGWTMLWKGEDRDNICTLAKTYNIAYDPDREPTSAELGFTTNWVQDATNQREIFRTFYRNIKPRKSLVVPYVKQVPFIEDGGKRIVMGVGFVESVKEPPEHNHTNTGKLRSMLWETMIGHSIRDACTDGFMLPYREMKAYADEHPDFDMRSITVFADDEYFEEFSYATEWLSHDAVISVLLQSIKALKIINQCIPKSGNWDKCIAWAKSRLAEVWRDRGAFPGAGMLLCSMGFKFGALIAEEIKDTLDEKDSFARRLEQAINEPKKYLSAEVGASIGMTELNAFAQLGGERKALFWLLSRFSLTLKQAQALFNRGYIVLGKNGKSRFHTVALPCTDGEMLTNPYVIYEKTRLLEPAFQIPLRSVDMAVYPPKEVTENDPLPSPSFVLNDNDERRVRAIAVGILEKQALNGHTAYPQGKLAAEMNELPLDPHCSVSGDVLNGLTGFFEPEISSVSMDNGQAAYTMTRMKEFDEIIRRTIEKLVAAPRFSVSENWQILVDEFFDGDKPLSDIKDAEEYEREAKARQEKAAILKELAESHISVLVGGAGTGKTTLLSLLCKSSRIKDGGVLLLAPTGKARVRMSQAMERQGVRFEAKTVAQFLVINGRFDFSALRYRLSDKDASGVPATVIIDESSMLTEEMFGSLLQALRKFAQRIIFVGDPNQLPPIGAGRPFVDLVRYLKKNVQPFPRVAANYGELTITRRQRNTNGSIRLDSALAEYFTNNGAELDGEIFAKLQANDCGDNIAFRVWNDSDELKRLIFDVLQDELGLDGADDIDGFDISLGGEVNSGWMNFGSNPLKIDDWQILSAYRNDQTIGTASLNRYLHQRYRIETKGKSAYKKQGTKHPLGTDGIMYGDKVINTRNQKREKSWAGYPSDMECQNYVANGEVGIVERIWKIPKDKKNTHQVKFSSQPKHCYNWPSKVSEEGSSDLELAYALTVHKSQGSEFGTVILVVSEPSGMLSKELLYTAITRQKSRIVILYNAEAYKLRSYSSNMFSDIARRITCLFAPPKIAEFEDGRRFFEEGLIHKTERGELVRSKSEIIVANALKSRDVEYSYESPLDLGADGVLYPDFTISANGTIFYWEHCGMLSDSTYRKRWEAKKSIYKKHGIIEGQNLIVSVDESNGSIDSQKISALIEQFDLGW